MVEASILYDILSVEEDRDKIKKTVISLIHESLTDENVTIFYSKDDDIYYPDNDVDVGKFKITDYVIEEKSDKFVIAIAAEYDDIAQNLKQVVSDSIVQDVKNVTTYLSLVLSCSQSEFSGDGEVHISAQ